MSIWGKIFGSDEAISKTIDTVSRGIDSLVYTDQEKAVTASQELSEARSMVVKWMESTQGQNLARRLIALSVTFVWLVQYIAALAISLVAVWVDNPAQWRDSANVIGDYAEAMNGAMMLILAFYFAAPHMGAIVGAAMSKFSGKGKV